MFQFCQRVIFPLLTQCSSRHIALSVEPLHERNCRRVVKLQAVLSHNKTDDRQDHAPYILYDQSTRK
jgi:hypothetical protein